MHGFGSNNQLWTEMRTFLAALASATCMTDGEKLKLSAIHSRMSTSITLRGREVDYFVAKVHKLMTVKEGSND